MHRPLALGLLACALVVAAAFVAVRALEGPPSVEIATSAALETRAEDVRLAGVAERSVPERASVPGVAPNLPRRADWFGHEVPVQDTGLTTIASPTFAGGIVEVRVVRDEDGEPIAGARVVLGVDRFAADEDARSASTDGHGFALFTGVDEGTSTVVASADGRAEAWSPAHVSREKPRVEVELRASIERAYVVHLVDPLGRPFRAEDWRLARVDADRIGILAAKGCSTVGREIEPRVASRQRATSAADGHGPYSWHLRVTGASSGCVHAVLHDVVIGAAAYDERASVVAIPVDVDAIGGALAPVVVRVLDEVTRAPIAGAGITFGDELGSRVDVRTDATGRVDLGRLHLKSRHVVVSAAGHGAVRMRIPRPTVEELAVRLPPGRRIAGRVLESDGGPSARAQVDLRGPDVHLVASAARRARTDFDGSFAFDDVPPAAFELVVTRDVGRRRRAVEPPQVATADCTSHDAYGIEIRRPAR